MGRSICFKFSCFNGIVKHARNYCSSSKNYRDSFSFSELQMNLASLDQLRPKPAADSLQFGKQFTDHMLTVEWSSEEGWRTPFISPLRPLSLHPASKVLHYASELFEGMKAYRGFDDRIRLFRPRLNMQRMNRSASRCVLPSFNGDELISCIKQLITVDREWVPHSASSSLYIRPTLIGTEPTLGVSASNEAMLFVIMGPVGSYFSSGLRPVSLLATPDFTRAWHGGCGFAKMGSNYAPTVMVQRLAENQRLQQVLWLHGEEHHITEVGTMNLFCVFADDSATNGSSRKLELVTPPLDGIVLPGVTRQSILDLARDCTQEDQEVRVSERHVSMQEIIQAINDQKLLEMFGSGTACVVCPIERLHYMGRDLLVPTPEGALSVAHRMLTALHDIQYGRVQHEWAELVDG